MKLENAYQGVKKIFTAEILALIATICSTIVLLFTVTTIASVNAKSAAGAAASLGGLTIFGLAAGVLAIIGFIFQILGINAASKDEPSFKTALYLIIAGIIVAVVGAFFNNQIVKTVFTAASDIISLFITITIINGVCKLAERVGNTDVQQKGVNILKLIIAMYVIIIIARIISAIFTGTGGAAVAGVFIVIAGVISIVQYVLYLMFLKKGRDMLA
ncbi:MAG TPA: hypothetical protein DEO32_03020 [Ruminococcaceae bacterium]|nr:hypothetical protein [Oscillospiraceae bacterium]